MNIGGFTLVLAGICVPFFLASHLFCRRVPALRYMPSVLLLLAVLFMVAAAGTQRPTEAAAMIVLAMITGLAFLFTLIFTVIVHAGIERDQAKDAEK